jgi:hypothetical protein
LLRVPLRVGRLRHAATEPGVTRRRVTFFASPKKVTKERRPHEAGLLALQGISGPCAKLAPWRSLRQALGTSPLSPRTAAASPSGLTPSMGTRRTPRRAWMPPRARLSLVTFFAKTKKVMGRAALKRKLNERNCWLQGVATRAAPQSQRFTTE